MSSVDRPGVVFTGVVISALGAMPYNLLPLVLGTAQDFRQLGDQAMGILGSTLYAGFTLTTLTAYFWIRRFSWRVVTFGALLLGVAALLSAGFAATFPALLVAMFVAGGAFSAFYGIGTTMLGDTGQPARWYGLKIAAEAGLGALLLLIIPGSVIARWGFEGLLVAMAAVLVLLAPMLARLPARGRSRGPYAERSGQRAIGPLLRIALWLGLAAVAVYLLCATMIWAFIERVAQDAGFAPAATGNVLSLGLVLAMGGSLMAMVLGQRYGLAAPLGASTAVLLASLFLLAGIESLVAYAVAACLFTFAFGLGIPYLVTVVARLDADGRFVVLTAAAIGIGVMLAPAVGGMLVGAGGQFALSLGGGLGALAALALALTALRVGLPEAEQARAIRREEAAKTGA